MNCDCCCRYSYAIVGINLTEMAYSLLKNGALKAHLYNAVPGLPQMEHFHQFYCKYPQLFQCRLLEVDLKQRESYV